MQVLPLYAFSFRLIRELPSRLVLESFRKVHVPSVPDRKLFLQRGPGSISPESLRPVYARHFRELSRERRIIISATPSGTRKKLFKWLFSGFAFLPFLSSRVIGEARALARDIDTYMRASKVVHSETFLYT